MSAPEESALKPGDRVAAVTMNGGYAERIAVPPENVFATAADLDDAEAVALLRRRRARQAGAGALMAPTARHCGSTWGRSAVLR